MLAVVVGFEQRAYHQHGCACGAHDGGKGGADGEQKGVELGGAVQIAPYEDAARDGV